MNLLKNMFELLESATLSMKSPSPMTVNFLKKINVVFIKPDLNNVENFLFGMKISKIQLLGLTQDLNVKELAMKTLR